MKDLREQEKDEELIEKTKQGDKLAFDLLVKKYQKKIYYLAYRMTKDHDSADDIAQETFVKAYLSQQPHSKRNSGKIPWKRTSTKSKGT